MKDSHLKHFIFGLDTFISCQRIITLSLGSVHKSKTCVSLQGRCGLPPPPFGRVHTICVAVQVGRGPPRLKRRSNPRCSSVIHGRIWNPKKNFGFRFENQRFWSQVTPPLRTFNGYELCTATKLCVLFRYHNMKVSRPKTKCFRWVFRFFGNLFENLYAMA